MAEYIENMEVGDLTETMIWDVNKNYPRLKKSARIAVIVYMTEDDSIDTEYGTADKNQLCNLWRTLGFDDIRTLPNPTRGELADFVMRLVAEINEKEMEHDAFTFAFIGHGNCRMVSKPGHTLKCEYMVLGKENNAPTVFAVDELLIMFTPFNCKGLAGCPKFFIYQCCRGQKTEFPVFVTASTPSETTISQYSDMYCYHGSAPGHVSYYDYHNGKSLLISTICEVFLNGYENQHFDQMITTVNDIVSTKMLGNGRCQTPVTSLGSLRKLFLFHGFGGRLLKVQDFDWIPQSARAVGSSSYETASSAAQSSPHQEPLDGVMLDEAIKKTTLEGLTNKDIDYQKALKIANTEMRAALRFLFKTGCPKSPRQTLKEYLKGPSRNMSDKQFKNMFFIDQIEAINRDPSGDTFDVSLLSTAILNSCDGLTPEIKDLVKNIKDFRNYLRHNNPDDINDFDLSRSAKKAQEMVEKLYHAVGKVYGVDVTEELWQRTTAITHILHS